MANVFFTRPSEASRQQLSSSGFWRRSSQRHQLQQWSRCRCNPCVSKIETTVPAGPAECSKSKEHQVFLTFFEFQLRSKAHEGAAADLAALVSPSRLKICDKLFELTPLPNPRITGIHMGTYAATLLLGGAVAMLSLMWLTSLEVHFSQGAGMTIIATATLYSAELCRFIKSRTGRFSRPQSI